jgi:hypothetical protein
VARRGADGVIGLEIDENMVDGFVAGSPAATDGIFYEGDRIASVDGKLVEAGRQMIEFMKPGLPKYTFGVVRSNPDALEPKFVEQLLADSRTSVTSEVDRSVV